MTRQIEGLLETGNDQVDAAATQQPVDVGDIAQRALLRRGDLEIVGDEARVAAGGAVERVGGEDPMSRTAELADLVERHGHARAGDEDVHGRPPSAARRSRAVRSAATSGDVCSRSARARMLSRRGPMGSRRARSAAAAAAPAKPCTVAAIEAPELITMSGAHKISRR